MARRMARRRRRRRRRARHDAYAWMCWVVRSRRATTAQKGGEVPRAPPGIPQWDSRQPGMAYYMGLVQAIVVEVES